jgi:superfamily II DNA or RNA helicase
VTRPVTTGVDARNIRNIVLMRPINSMIEFKQIIGRGTRLYDGKDYRPALTTTLSDSVAGGCRERNCSMRIARARSNNV